MSCLFGTSEAISSALNKRSECPSTFKTRTSTRTGTTKTIRKTSITAQNRIKHKRVKYEDMNINKKDTRELKMETKRSQRKN